VHRKKVAAAEQDIQGQLQLDMLTVSISAYYVTTYELCC
jgi:hypothetical protein